MLFPEGSNNSPSPRSRTWSLPPRPPAEHHRAKLWQPKSPHLEVLQVLAERKLKWNGGEGDSEKLTDPGEAAVCGSWLFTVHQKLKESFEIIYV